MIIFLSIALGICLVLIGILAVGTKNVLTQNEAYEDYFKQLQSGLESVQHQLKVIDRNGAFEADDEVGAMFAAIKGMITSLNTFLVSI